MPGEVAHEKRHTAGVAVRVSIVMPVLNEATGIAGCLADLQSARGAGHEVIVVDGGSRDDTVARARPLADHLLVSAPGRARQMNAGLGVARGDVVLFLHADTRLPAGAIEAIAREAGSDPDRLWGRFDVRIAGRSAMLPVVAAFMNTRSRLTGVATGDQAMFASRDLLGRVGGFPELPLMEDIALSKALRRVRRPRCLRAQVTTSGRRWDRNGAWRTIVLMWWLRLAYFAGVSPARLVRWYYGPRGTA